MTQPTFTATASSRLAQDLLHSDQLLVKQASAEFADLVATYTDSAGAARALVIANDGLLYDVYRDETSDSGWMVDPIVTALGELAEIVCGTDGQTGTTSAFFTTSAGTLYTMQLDPTGWSQPTPVHVNGPATSLAAAYTAELGVLQLFALASDGTLLIVSFHDAAWIGATITLQGTSFSPSTPPVVTYLSEAVWLLAFCTDGLVHAYEGQGTTTSSGSQIALPNDAQAERVALAFQQGSETVLLVADDAGRLYSASYGSTAVPVALANPTAISRTTGFAIPSGFQVFGIDTAGTLWTFSVLGWSESRNAIWSAGAPYVSSVAAVSFDSSLNLPNASAAPSQEVFVLRGDFSVELLNVGGSGQFRPLPVSRPTPGTPNTIITYQTRVSLTDQDGIAAPGVTLRLTASAPTYVWYAHTMSLVSAQNPLTVQTDGFGGVTLSMPAFAATAPAITVSTVDATLATFHPDAQLHQYLSSSTSTESYLPPFGGDALTNATAHNPDGSRGASVAPLLQGQNALATVAAQTMTACSQSILNMQQNTAPAVVGWISDLGSSYNAYSDTASWSEAYDAAFGQWAAVMADGAPGGIFSSFDDLLTAIANGVGRIINAGFEAETKILTLVIEVDEDLFSFVAGVIHNPADIGALFNALVRKIEAQTADFLNWLAHFLPFAEIAAAQQSIKSIMQSATPLFATALRQVQTDVDQTIADAEQKVQNDLLQFFDQYKDVSLAELLSGTELSRAGSLAGTSTAPLNTSDAHWFFSKLPPAGGGAPLNLDFAAPTAAMTALYTQLDSPPLPWQAVIADFEKLAAALGSVLSDVASPGDVTLGSFISNISGLVTDVLDFVKVVADLLLDAGIDALDSLDALWEQSVLTELGALGSIISAIAELAGVTISASILDVFSLAAAVVAVLLSWAVTGNARIDFPATGTQQLLEVVGGVKIPAITFILGYLAIASVTIVDIGDTISGSGQLLVLLMIFLNSLALVVASFSLPGMGGWTWTIWVLDVLLVILTVVLLGRAVKSGGQVAVYARTSSLVFSVVGWFQAICGGINMSVTGTKFGFVTAFEFTGPFCVNGLECLTVGSEPPLLLAKSAANGLAMAQLVAGLASPTGAAVET